MNNFKLLILASELESLKTSGHFPSVINPMNPNTDGIQKTLDRSPLAFFDPTANTHNLPTQTIVTHKNTNRTDKHSPTTMMFLRSLLPFFVLSTSLTLGQNTKEFSNDDYTVSVKVKSNQPRFYYWANNDPNKSKYRVAFSKIYESKNGTKASGSNLALASIDWIIEEDTEAPEDSVVFWINGTTKEKGNGNKADRFSVLSFRNEIVNGTIKFDVIVDDYSWVDPTADTLDLEWKLTNSTGADTDTDEEPVRQRVLRTLMGRSLADEVPASESSDLICWYGAGGDADNQVRWFDAHVKSLV